MTCRSYKGIMHFCFWRKMVASTKLQSVIWCRKDTTLDWIMACFGYGILLYLYSTIVLKVPGSSISCVSFSFLN